MDTKLDENGEALHEGPTTERPVEIRCGGGCGKLIFMTCRGAIDPMKLHIQCQKCQKDLIFGDWQMIRDKNWITLFNYRCDNCNAVYEKVFYGYERLCKGCKTYRVVFIAASAGSAVLVENRSAA